MDKNEFNGHVNVLKHIANSLTQKFKDKESGVLFSPGDILVADTRVFGDITPRTALMVFGGYNTEELVHQMRRMRMTGSLPMDAWAWYPHEDNNAVSIHKVLTEMTVSSDIREWGNTDISSYKYRKINDEELNIIPKATLKRIKLMSTRAARAAEVKVGDVVDVLVVGDGPLMGVVLGPSTVPGAVTGNADEILDLVHSVAVLWYRNTDTGWHSASIDTINVPVNGFIPWDDTMIEDVEDDTYMPLCLYTDDSRDMRPGSDVYDESIDDLPEHVRDALVDKLTDRGIDVRNARVLKLDLNDHMDDIPKRRN